MRSSWVVKAERLLEVFIVGTEQVGSGSYLVHDVKVDCDGHSPRHVERSGLL